MYYHVLEITFREKHTNTMSSHCSLLKKIDIVFQVQSQPCDANDQGHVQQQQRTVYCLFNSTLVAPIKIVFLFHGFMLRLGVGTDREM